jgi:hypothetical protein
VAVIVAAVVLTSMMMVLSHTGPRFHLLAQGDVLVVIAITIFLLLNIVAVPVATTFVLAIAAIAITAIVILILAVVVGQILEIENFKFLILDAATAVAGPGRVDKNAGYIIVEEW